MKIHRFLATACMVALSTAATAAATPNPASTGYPPGRPWDAVSADFRTVFAKVDSVKADTVLILQRLGVIQTDITAIKQSLATVSADVATLKNTLTVQVSVVPNVDREGGTNLPVVLNVLVSRNGAGVAGLQPAAFGFTSAFGSGGASYCGTSTCMVAGPGGVYQLQLTTSTTWAAGQYAGSMTASMGSGATLAQGTTLVTFDVPAAAP